jgi:MFS family permease
VLAAETAGMLAGAIVALRMRARRVLLLGVVCCSGDVVLLAALGGAPHVAVLIPVGFVAGICLEQFGIAWEVSIQEHIPADKLARVYSYDALGSFLAVPVGQIAAGPVADATGPALAIYLAAAIAALAVVAMLASRSVRSLTHHPGSATEDSAAVSTTEPGVAVSVNAVS